jgi:hypothetical protein
MEEQITQLVDRYMDVYGVSTFLQLPRQLKNKLATEYLAIVKDHDPAYFYELFMCGDIIENKPKFIEVVMRILDKNSIEGGLVNFFMENVIDNLSFVLEKYFVKAEEEKQNDIYWHIKEVKNNPALDYGCY